MQNPVGFTINEELGRAELTDIGPVLTNPVVLASFPHTIVASVMFAAVVVVVVVAAWHLRRGHYDETMRTALRFGRIVNLIALAGLALSGDQLSLVMVDTQPMKMAAAKGINDLQARYAAEFGPGDYTPSIWVTYWSFRWMIALGALAALVALAALRALAALVASLVGWIFTEIGRQPWLVFGLMKTEDGVSPGVTGLEVLISLIAFTVVYGALAAVEFRLIRRAAIEDPRDWQKHDDPDDIDATTLTTVY